MKRWDKIDKKKFPLKDSDNVSKSLGIMFDIVEDLFERVYILEQHIKKIEPSSQDVSPERMEKGE